MYINMKFGGFKFSTTVDENDNVINIEQYQYITAVYLVTFSVAVGQTACSTKRISCL